VDLPLGTERELVRDRDRTYEVNGTDSRVLATVGAFRVIAELDIERAFDHPASARDSVKHLEAEGLLRRSRSGPDERVTFLSDRGRDLLEACRWERDDRYRRPDQAFYAGLRKPRELGHDSQVYRAYLRAEERLRGAGGRVRRVVLDYELKRDYQRFLQERNRDRPDSDGRPHRTSREIEAWAREHRLPYFDERVHFPDLRIEYDDREGYGHREDIEVLTAHYRGAHAAATARSGFTRYRSGGGLAGGRGGGGRRGSAMPRLAEELL
jgi:DNA-binding MarR family transcriptional regulator